MIPPSPPSELFRKFIRFGRGRLPKVLNSKWCEEEPRRPLCFEQWVKYYPAKTNLTPCWVNPAKRWQLNNSAARLVEKWGAHQCTSRSLWLSSWNFNPSTMFKVLILVLFTSIHIVLNKDGVNTGEHIFDKKVFTNNFFRINFWQKEFSAYYYAEEHEQCVADLITCKEEVV